MRWNRRSQKQQQQQQLWLQELVWRISTFKGKYQTVKKHQFWSVTPPFLMGSCLPPPPMKLPAGSKMFSHFWFLVQPLSLMFSYFFGCPRAYQIPVPQPGMELPPLQWKYSILTTGLPGISLVFGAVFSLRHYLGFSFFKEQSLLGSKLQQAGPVAGEETGVLWSVSSLPSGGRMRRKKKKTCFLRCLLLTLGWPLGDCL